MPARARSWRAALLASVAVSLTLVGCGSDGPETIVEEAEEEGFTELVEGQPFEGTALVTEVVSPHAFLLLDTLVISEDEVDVTEEERVRVAGTIRDVTVEDLERELGITLDEVEDVHDGDLLVVADEVEAVEFVGPDG